MAKSTVTYWSALNRINDDKWEVIEGSDNLLEQLTLAIDEESGDYTRLTRFRAGADTRHLVPGAVIIRKKYLLSKAGYMMRRLISGWYRVITLVDHQESYMGYSGLRKNV